MKSINIKNILDYYENFVYEILQKYGNCMDINNIIHFIEKTYNVDADDCDDVYGLIAYRDIARIVWKYSSPYPDVRSEIFFNAFQREDRYDDSFYKWYRKIYLIKL